MTEKIIVRQYKDYQVEFEAVDPHQPDSENYQAVHGLHEITPYGMMLVSLATCTGQVVLSYANHHGLDLEQVEFRMRYDRDYREDCDNCQHTGQYQEIISEQITFQGGLSSQEEEKLFKIAHQCPIEKIFRQGIEIKSALKQN